MSKRPWKKEKQKTSTLILSICILLISACHSNLLLAKSVADLPPVVAQSFSQQYPHTTIKSFKKDNNTFTLQFINNNRAAEASFSQDGKWLQTTTRIKHASELPPNIKNAFDSSQYASWYINNISKCEMPNESSYSFEISNGNLLDSDHSDAFLQTRRLSIDRNGGVKIYQLQ